MTLKLCFLQHVVQVYIHTGPRKDAYSLTYMTLQLLDSHIHFMTLK